MHQNQTCLTELLKFEQDLRAVPDGHEGWTASAAQMAYNQYSTAATLRNLFQGPAMRDGMGQIRNLTQNAIGPVRNASATLEDLGGKLTGTRHLKRRREGLGFMQILFMVSAQLHCPIFLARTVSSQLEFSAMQML